MFTLLGPPLKRSSQVSIKSQSPCCKWARLRTHRGRRAKRPTLRMGALEGYLCGIQCSLFSCQWPATLNSTRRRLSGRRMFPLEQTQTSKTWATNGAKPGALFYFSPCLSPEVGVGQILPVIALCAWQGGLTQHLWDLRALFHQAQLSSSLRLTEERQPNNGKIHDAGWPGWLIHGFGIPRGTLHF